ncbi:MAG: EF-hand domain-containing protein [Gammaproteobacteria bacterium]|nr:EF-hand domain-containing protein [Gammaproteobacteria bacterium]
MKVIIKKTIPVGLIVAVAGIFLPAGAFAEEIPVSGSIPSSIFDTDNDGFISKEEFNSVFAEFDTNADGKLNRDEILAGRRALMDKRFDMLMQKRREMRPGRMGGMMPTFNDFDLDGDGKIPQDEFNQAREKRIKVMNKRGYPMKHMAVKPPFSDIDSNGDGVIDEDEFRKHQQQRFEQMRKNRDTMWEQRWEMRRSVQPRRDMPGPMPFFSDFDLNDNGKITEQEFNEAREKRMKAMKERGYPMRNMEKAPAFSDMDTNNDGAVSEDEFYDMQSRRHQQMMKERREMMIQQRREMRRYMEPGKGMGRPVPDYSDYDLEGKNKTAK